MNKNQIYQIRSCLFNVFFSEKRKKIWYLTALLSWVCGIPFHTFGQDKSEDLSFCEWGLQVGWTHSLISDQHTSPLLYASHAAQVGVIYRHTSKAFIEVALTLNIGSNQSTEYGKRIATLADPADIHGNISTYEIEVNPFLSMMNGAISVKSLWRLNSYHQLGVVMNAQHILAGLGADTWHYTQLDLSPSYQFVYPFQNTSLKAAIELPVLAVIVRPTYAKDASLPDVVNYWWGYVKTNTKTVMVNHLLNPNAQIGISYPLKSGRTIEVNYEASWRSYALPRPLRMFEQGLNIQYFF